MDMEMDALGAHKELDMKAMSGMDHKSLREHLRRRMEIKSPENIRKDSPEEGKDRNEKTDQ
jgi:DNA repair protein RadC